MVSALLLGTAGLLVVVAVGSLLAALGNRRAAEESTPRADVPLPR